MKKLLVLLFIFTSFTVFSQSGIVIHEDQIDNQVYYLAGAQGFAGKDGGEGFSKNCENGLTQDGSAGEDGRSGENGENGKNAFIYTDDLSSLRTLVLNQAGGAGGNPGIGGRGSEGCHGGFPGNNGIDGNFGKNGKKGMVFLLNKGLQLPVIKQSYLTTVGELFHKPKTLGKHIWSKRKGLKELVHPNSNVRSEYYEYTTTDYKTVKLVWNTSHDIKKFSGTKIAFTNTAGSLKVTSYQGALLDYQIQIDLNQFTIIINNILEVHQIQNLKLKKLKGEGESLVLVVNEKFRPFLDIKTHFVISLTKVINQKENDSLGFIEIPPSLVDYKNNAYLLNIGKLRIHPSFKEAGVKLKILLTIKRKVHEQTRAYGLDGLFKI